jgi:hypothetical protein
MCDTFYICKNFDTGHSQQQIGTSLRVLAAIEIAALANIHFPVGDLENAVHRLFVELPFAVQTLRRGRR